MQNGHLLEDRSRRDSSSHDTEHDGLLGPDLEGGEKPVAAPSLPPTLNHEDTVSTRRKLLALAGYFICNVGLTIYNKAVLGSFPFPWLLTALHTGSSAIGCIIMLQAGVFRLSKLSRNEHLALAAFSLLFTINIAVSNVSLSMVSVPFHQLVRATTPLFTTILFRVFYGRTFSRETYLSLVPIIVGVFMATHGELSFTDLGFLMTFAGVLLAALKTILTNRIMTGSLALSFWEVLFRMSPLACAQSVLYALITGELAEFRRFLVDQFGSSAAAAASADDLMQSGVAAATQNGTTSTSSSTTFTHFALIMLGNGALAFALNVSSFSTNKVAGALTMTVCANIKQCLTIVLGGILFGVQLTALNVGGVVVALGGGALYSFVELDSKRKKAAAAAEAAAAATGPEGPTNR